MKRIIATVIVSNNRVVNAYSFREYRPCASFKHTFQRLQEWEIDELLVLNRTHSNRPSDDMFALLGKSPPYPLATPMSYGGGVMQSSLDEIKKLVNLGVERVVVSAASIRSRNELSWLEKAIGEQAIVIHIPTPFDEMADTTFGSNIVGHDRIKQIAKEFSNWGGEVVITDCLMEGMHECRVNFLANAANLFENVNVSVGGGICSPKDAEKLLSLDAVGGIYLDNLLNRFELALSRFRAEMSLPLLRQLEVE